MSFEVIMSVVRNTEVDCATEPAKHRAPMTFTEIYLGNVALADFRKNLRSELAHIIHDGSSRNRQDATRDGRAEPREAEAYSP
jgi:hypothetical protein